MARWALWRWVISTIRTKGGIMVRRLYGDTSPLMTIWMACWMIGAVPTLAPAAESGKADTLEEVIVTARKTSESLQTTPVAVTALSEAALTQQQVLDVSDLQHAAPDVA